MFDKHCRTILSILSPPGCPVPFVLSYVSCSNSPSHEVLSPSLLSPLFYLHCHVLAVLSFPYGPDRPVKDDLMDRFVQTNLYRLYCSKISYPRCAVPTVLSSLSCHAGCTWLPRPSSPDPAAIFWPSGPFLPVLPVISRLSFFSGCHVPLPVPAVLSQLSCLSCPAKNSNPQLFCHPYLVLVVRS